MGKKIVAILMFFYLSVYSAAPPNMSNTDMSSLLALKSGFNSHILAQNWTLETSFCTWIGVTCSRRRPRVTSMDLSSMDLRGSIGREIGNLSFLAYLYINNNSISGPIPDEIGNLRRLRVLNMSTNHLTGELLSSTILNISSLLYLNVGDNHLSGSLPKHICSQSTKLESLGLHKNRFEGEFPSAVTHCHSLKKLSLYQNNLTGNIPTGFWNLSALEWVSFSRNKFTGIIPPSVANLTNLAKFSIFDNSFRGTIPSEIKLLSSLTFLDLAKNMLNGEVPQSIFNSSSLQVLSLGHNNLSGNLPFSIDKGIPNIEQFLIPENQFYGEIPSSISNLSKLNLLELSINSFTGHIPITLGNLRRLSILSLFENQFTNNLSVPEQDFLSPLEACNYLTVILVSANPIMGVLPKSLGSANLSASLVAFDAESCQIRSPIPNEIGNLSNLIFLNLGINELTGAIPTALGNLRNLQGLGLYLNKFRGSISHAMCNMGNLHFIDFSDNHLFGQLPNCLGNLSSLRKIDFSDNEFNFTIPATSWFDEHVQGIYWANNFLHGSVPGEIGNMKDLTELDLSGNQLSGEIPSPLLQLQKLINLSLSNNNLFGPIPDSFSNSNDLQYLDFSRNRLSGPIPTSLMKLKNLIYLNISYNQLSGKIPDGGHYLNFTLDSFIGNKGLCGDPQFQVGACKRSKSTPLSGKNLLKYIIPAVASVALAVIILIFVLRRCGTKLSPSPSVLPLVVVPEKIISYNDILRATNNLDEENIIGRGSFGSVYKGNISDGMVVAVKVFNLDVQGAFKSFDIECQIFRSIRHRNLVKVITSCSNLDFKALVTVYMPNGNLEKWLYSEDCPLNITQRLGIVIDVAFAVEYLHEGDTSPIVHCDLKPNNILLDEDMVAHVGDFGIAKLLTQEQRMLQTTTLGTIGYIAPEYGSEGLVSTMADVYSYGILLMEVFTRRRPTDEMFSGELTIRRWMSESLPNSVMQIVDRELLNMDDQRSRARHERCLTSTMELAVECTADLAEERPKMKDVVARMNKIKLNLSVHNR